LTSQPDPLTVTTSEMPPRQFQHNARRHLPKARHRVTNWPAYEAGLKRRGNVTFWLDEAALAGWRRYVEIRFHPARGG
jgi:hypothetical protein